MKRINVGSSKCLRLLGLAGAVLAFAMVFSLGTAGSKAYAGVPRAGSLRVIGPDGAYCPLKHTDVVVDISGFIARVTLTQHFENPYATPIEAIYTFPMSDRGAVDAMTMTIGDRVITGKIDRREAARQIYNAARAAGRTASLLDQERPNIFTQSVANIMPGSPIDITISYVEYLKYDGGEYEYSFPMVVGPRYNPAPSQHIDGGRLVQGSDPVPDRTRITPPITPEGTRAGHDISLIVNLNAGLPIRNIVSDLHEVDLTRVGPERAIIALKNKKEIPNRDFVLRYAVAGKAIGDAVLTHAGPKGKFFSLILQPPERVAPDEAAPKEMIFVIDRSGSMNGFPIEKAKKTMRMAIEQMNPNDTFNLVSFAGGLGYCFPQPMPNTPANRATALKYLANLHGSGGTEMMRAIHAALGNQNDPERLRVVCFMTDGFIGNDMAILDAIQKYRKTARVFVFGIGNSVNRFLIENMAREGRGASEIVTLESDAEAAAGRFHARIQSPVLTDITIDFGELEVEGVTPSPALIPDLFASRPLILTGRYTKAGSGIVTVRGRTAHGPFVRKVMVDFPSDQDSNDVLASLWARERIDEIMARDWLGMQRGRPNANIREEIAQLGLDFGLVTQFTSFVAVEDRVVNENGELITITVPVEMPDGVSYEGVFGGGRMRKAAAQALNLSIAQSRMESLGYLGRSAAAVVPGQFREMLLEDADRLITAPRSSRDINLGIPVKKDQPATERVDSENERFAPEDDEAARQAKAKLAPALHRLVAGLSGTAIEHEGLKVTNGRVEVFIRLLGESDDHIEILKRMGVDIVSFARSSKTVLARVRIDQLEKVAGLAFVHYVEPPKY